MRNTFSFETMNPIGILIGLGGLIFAGWQAKKSMDMAKKLDKTMEELEKSTPVEVKDAIVEKAIENAVDRHVAIAVADTSKRIRSDIESDISEKVKKEVKANVDRIASDVGEAISDQVANIDPYALQEKVKKQAERKMTGMLEDGVKGILNQYRQQYGNLLGLVNGIVGSNAPWNNSGRNSHTVSFNLDN